MTAASSGLSSFRNNSPANSYKLTNFTENSFNRQAQRSIPLVVSVFLFRLVCNEESGTVLIWQIVICSFSCQQCLCCHHRLDKQCSFWMWKEKQTQSRIQGVYTWLLCTTSHVIMYDMGCHTFPPAGTPSRNRSSTYIFNLDFNQNGL